MKWLRVAIFFIGALSLLTMSRAVFCCCCRRPVVEDNWALQSYRAEVYQTARVILGLVKPVQTTFIDNMFERDHELLDLISHENIADARRMLANEMFTFSRACLDVILTLSVYSKIYAPLVAVLLENHTDDLSSTIIGEAMLNAVTYWNNDVFCLMVNNQAFMKRVSNYVLDRIKRLAEKKGNRRAFEALAAACQRRSWCSSCVML